MPEMIFTVQWPNGSRQQCYSPSLVMHDYLSEGTDYSVDEFVELSRTALTVASDRVRAKFGFACTSAAATMSDIVTTAEEFETGSVRIVAMSGLELIGLNSPSKNEGP